MILDLCEQKENIVLVGAKQNRAGVMGIKETEMVKRIKWNKNQPQKNMHHGSIWSTKNLDTLWWPQNIDWENWTENNHK